MRAERGARAGAGEELAGKTDGGAVVRGLFRYNTHSDTDVQTAFDVARLGWQKVWNERQCMDIVADEGGESRQKR